MAFDLPRAWANGVQITPTSDGVFFVFREQVNVTSESGEEPDRLMLRNVASVLMPTNAARAFLSVFQVLMEPLSQEAEELGDDAA